MKKRLVQFIIFLVPAAMLAGFVFGYDCAVIHPKLTRAAADVYNQETKARKITEKEKNWIVQGAIDEDMHPRYANHFYNPETGDGLYFLGAQASAKDWAQDQSSVTGNFDVKTILLDYENDNYERAFTGLGHILHLIEDMSVPAHTRLDAHEEGDPYEAWAYQNDPEINLGDIDILSYENLDQAFDQLASYSHFNFFSKDTMFYVKEREIRSEKLEGKNGVYIVYCQDNFQKEFACARKTITPNLILYEIKREEDLIIHQDYWRMLSPKAVGVAAGVIDMFMKKFAEIDEEKLADRQDNFLSLWGQEALYDVRLAFGELKLLLGYAVDGTGDKIAEGVGLYKEFGAEGQKLAFDTIKNSPQIIAGKSLDVMGDLREGIESIRVLGESIAMSNDEAQKGSTRQGGEGDFMDSSSTTSPVTGVTPFSVRTNLEDADETVSIKYIIDGDTFVLTNEDRVRLIGIDTPELNKSGEEDDECLAEWAKIRLQQMLDSGEPVLISDPGMDKDKYGRLLRYVYADDVFINEQLAAEGLAEIFFCEPYFKNCPLAEDKERKTVIIKANEKAQAEKKGIYSSFCVSNNEETVPDKKEVFISYGGAPQVVPVQNEVGEEKNSTETGSSTSNIASTTLIVGYQEQNGTSTPVVSTSTPQIGTSTPIIATSTPQIGTSTPVIATSTPQTGTTTPEVATSTPDIASSTTEDTNDQASSTDPGMPDHLLISEISAHGPMGRMDEFIEFYNPTDEIQHISGYKLQNSAPESDVWKTRFNFKHPRIVIYPHDHYLMASDYFYNTIKPDIIISSYFGFNDEGGNIRLLDNNGAVVDMVAYGSGKYGEGEAAVADFENKYSLERGDYDTDNNKNDFFIQPVPNPQDQRSAHFKYEWILNEDNATSIKNNISGDEITLNDLNWKDNLIDDYIWNTQSAYLDHSLLVADDKNIEIPLDIGLEYGFTLSFWYHTASTSEGKISLMLKDEEDSVGGGVNIYHHGFYAVAGENNLYFPSGKSGFFFENWNFCVISYNRKFNRIYVVFPTKYKNEGKEGPFIKNMPDTRFSKLIIDGEGLDFSLNRIKVFDMPLITDEMYKVYFEDMGQKQYN